MTSRQRSTGSLAGLRIVIVQQVLEMGGAERQRLLLAQWLRVRAEAKVEIWGFARRGNAADRCEQLGIPWRLVPWAWDGPRRSRLLGFMRFLATLRAARPDVLLPYTMPPNVACGWAWRLAGAQTCIWNQRDEGRHRFALRWERGAVRRTPFFLSNSQHGARFLIETLHVPEQRTRVIHNGVALAPPQTDRPAFRARLGLREDALVACMVANFHTSKDHATLIRAWRWVTDEARDWPAAPQLVLAGYDYGEMAGLKLLARDLGIADRVLFPGQVTDIPALLHASDVGVLSSMKEGVPNAVLESMAARLAVVGTDIPGIREALGPDCDEVVASPRDDRLLAQRILQFLGNSNARRERGARNRRRIHTEFSRDRMCQQTGEVISACVRGDLA